MSFIQCLLVSALATVGFVAIVTLVFMIKERFDKRKVDYIRNATVIGYYEISGMLKEYTNELMEKTAQMMKDLD